MKKRKIIVYVILCMISCILGFVTEALKKRRYINKHGTPPGTYEIDWSD